MPSLWSRDGDVLDLDLHPGQARAWSSDKRIVATFAGTQGGKTSFLPWLLWREIRERGSGDYLAVTATYDLFKVKFLPALREVFEQATGWGRYWGANKVIELANPTTNQFQARRADDAMWGRIILRSAESKAGVESATAKAAILDEAGMDTFTVDTYEAIERRLALARGRMFLGTTLYNLGWLKTTIYDPWKAAAGKHPAIDVIQFDSTENPAYPREVFDDARARMPAWKFDMFYRGRFSRPAGMIYDCFSRDIHLVPPFALPDAWPRYGGLDFGGVHTAALRVAAELQHGPGGTWGGPTGVYYVYAEYLAGERTAAEHVRELLAGEPTTPAYVGGSGSEDSWRREFRAAGLPVREPDQPLVEIGIARVYGALKTGKLKIFSSCTGLVAELESYSRVVDAAGEPTEAIANKASYHRLDALRYSIGWLTRTNKPGVR